MVKCLKMSEEDTYNKILFFLYLSCERFDLHFFPPV